MQSTQNFVNIEQALRDLFEPYPFISLISERIYTAGGTPYLVGGAVRDLVLGLPIHDLDIEVHGLSLEQLALILKEFGIVSYVGKSFGVLKLHGTNIDWSLPRTDTAGRKPVVSIDPFMNIIEALRRRDLTMNAMAIELGTQQFVDPFNGLKDMQDCVLRSPDAAFFTEDPLRFYRVMQFMGRFKMFPDSQLEELCRQMDISGVSIERIEDEFEKLFIKSSCPSLGLRWLVQIGRLHEILPELANTGGIKQEPDWHPEGDVFEHLMQTVDAAARISVPTLDEKLTLMYAALCHDLGKVSTTIYENGRIKSPGHAEEGVLFTRSLLKRITRKNKIVSAVVLLVKYHMQPGQFIKLNSGLAAYRRLALKLAKYTTIEMLSRLVLADRQGRNPAGHEPLTVVPSFIHEFLERAEEAQALRQAEQPILRGRDIADIVAPGKEMGRLLHYAYEQQLRHGIKDKKLLKKKVIQKIKREKRV